MTRTARSIAGGDRGRRLRPSRTDTEIGRVAVALDEMLDAVEGAERQALAAEERVRSFLSDAAHELRTPVAGVRAAADTLVRTGDDDPTTREVLAVHVVRQADRAARLVDDMLTMARLDRGLVLDRRRTDLVAWVRSEAERLRLRLPGIDLRTDLPDDPVWVEADADRLAQVLGNLVDNAARATGGTGTVRVALTTHRDGVELRVDDDGPGIPAADRERVFDRLVRLEAVGTPGPAAPGSGCRSPAGSPPPTAAPWRTPTNRHSGSGLRAPAPGGGRPVRHADRVEEAAVA